MPGGTRYRCSRVLATKSDHPIRITDSHRRQMAILLQLALDDVWTNARKLVGQALRYEIIGPSRREYGDAERTSYRFRASTDRVTELDGIRVLGRITVLNAELPAPEVPLVVPMDDYELFGWLQIIQLVNTGKVSNEDFATKIVEPLPRIAAALNWDRNHADWVEPAWLRRELLMALGSVLLDGAHRALARPAGCRVLRPRMGRVQGPGFHPVAALDRQSHRYSVAARQCPGQLPSLLLKPVILLERTYAIGDSKENRFEEAAGRALRAVDRAIFLMSQLDKEKPGEIDDPPADPRGDGPVAARRRRSVRASGRIRCDPTALRADPGPRHTSPCCATSQPAPTR